MPFTILKHGIQTFIYALREESLSTILRNAFLFIFGSKANTYKLRKGKNAITQITHFYITPIKLEIEGWYSLSENSELKSMIIFINGKEFDLEINIQKPEIKSKFNLESENVGFYGLLPCTLIKSDGIKLKLNYTSSECEYFEISFKMPMYLEEEKLEALIQNSFTSTKSKIDKEQSVSIIIPFKDRIELLEKVLRSIKEKTKHPNYEIILMDNNSIEKNTKTFLKKISTTPNIRILKASYEFNFSKLMNEGVSHSEADYIVLLNNDIEIISKGWLTSLVQNCDKDVGCIGPLLIYEDGSIQHVGIVIPDWEPIYVQNLHPVDSIPNLGKMKEFQAITGACMFMKRDIYIATGGMDENLPVTLNDVDFCLTMREMGYKIVLDTHLQMIHHKSLSRGKHDAASNSKRSVKEKSYFKKKWSNSLTSKDPFYPPIFSSKYPDYRLKNT